MSALAVERRRPPWITWLIVRVRLSPWWARVLVIFAASRVFTTALLLVYASIQPQNPWTPASPNYFDFAAIWDGHWYYIIALVGYPADLPIDDDGYVGENAWAFMPAYPALVRGIMILTTLDFPIAAVLVSVAFAAAASLALYRLLRRFLPEGTTLFAVTLFLVAPLSPILQVAYAESMHLFLLFVALILLVERRYLTLMPVVAVMAVTRPSGLAFALTMLLHVIHRWAVRRRDPYPVREIVASLAAGLFSAFMGVAWLLIAGVVTGSPTAYTDTELAWRAPYVGHGHLVPFTPWIQATEFWGPYFGIGQPLLLVLLAIIAVGFAALLISPAGARVGTDIRFWALSYVLYLVAVFYPQSSTFRLLMPLAPVVGILAQPRSPWYRVGLVVLMLLAQWGWTHLGWWVDGRDWSPP